MIVFDPDPGDFGRRIRVSPLAKWVEGGGMIADVVAFAQNTYDKIMTKCL